MPQLFEWVRIYRLLHEPSHYDGWGVNRRAPQVGDVGIVVDILEAPDGRLGYVVECSDPKDGVDWWLSDFVAAEIERVADQSVGPSLSGKA